METNRNGERYMKKCLIYSKKDIWRSASICLSGKPHI